MSVNFSPKNEGVWFYFDPSNEELGGVCLREVTVDESRRIEKDTTTTHRKNLGGQSIEIKEHDEIGSFRLVMQYCLVDWKGVLVDGQPVECNAMGKERAMKCHDFVKFVTECIDNLTNKNESIIRDREEARVKNSEIGSNGSLPT